jgi:arginyl-tRNA--protein-N-Asp/Glu arginylyltransferase
MLSDSLPGYCGYCKDPVTNEDKGRSYKFRLYLKSIPVDIYEEMYSKGWTRCGQCVYLSNYEKTCCKLYQPRLNINNFQITKEQAKIMKRFRKFLSGEFTNKKENKTEENKNDENEIKNLVFEDNYKNIISQNVKNYINSANFVQILKTYIKDENEILIYLNKIKDTKIRRITNKKYNFNYSCDLIFIIKKIYSLKFNQNQNNSNVLSHNQIIDKEKNENDLKNLVNNIYNNFKENYKSNEEIISLSEETGHINFQIKNQKEYQEFLNKEKEFNTFNNKDKNNEKNSKNNNTINTNEIKKE